MKQSGFIAAIIVGLLIVLGANLLLLGVFYKNELSILFGALSAITLILFLYFCHVVEQKWKSNRFIKKREPCFK